MAVAVPADFEDCDVRAAAEYLAVHRVAPALYLVYSEQGSEYVVEPAAGHCTCPDHRYNGAACKHLRRVRMVRGERTVPEGVRTDPLLARQRERYGGR